ncbi:MAG: hypothetical protein Q7S14_03405, partial [bacterium]|nr:hypothetical protein [bacterium]
EKLLEKGVQQVFELETINGKKIRTTEEHPYLVRSGLFEKGNISEKGAGHSQPESNGNLNIQIKNIHNYLARNFLNLKAAVKDNIPKMMFTVNKPRLNGSGFSDDNGTIMAIPNHPDDRLTSNSETISRTLCGDKRI